MRVVLSDPSLVDPLVGQLRAFRLDTEREGENTVRVTMPPPAEDEPDNPPEQDEVELSFLIRAVLREHPEVSIIVDD